MEEEKTIKDNKDNKKRTITLIVGALIGWGIGLSPVLLAGWIGGIFFWFWHEENTLKYVICLVLFFIAIIFLRFLELSGGLR